MFLSSIIWVRHRRKEEQGVEHGRKKQMKYDLLRFLSTFINRDYAHNFQLIGWISISLLIFWCFYFFLKSFNLWCSLLMITLYHQTKTFIDFWCRRGLNSRSLIQHSSETLPSFSFFSHTYHNNIFLLFFFWHKNKTFIPPLFLMSHL